MLVVMRLETSCQQDEPRARSQHGHAVAYALSYGAEHPQLAEELALYGRLAARQYQTVERPQEVACVPELEALLAQLCEASLVLRERPLQRKHCGRHYLPLSAISSSISSLLMPTIASPRFSDSAATFSGSS